MNWYGTVELSAMQYRCGFCGLEVSSVKGIGGSELNLQARVSPKDQFEYYKRRAYICPHCNQVSFWNNGRIVSPLPPFGQEVDHLPNDVGAVYGEARKAMQASAFTGAVLLCRKILMHVAVGQNRS